jgi:hypothetical protein
LLNNTVLDQIEELRLQMQKMASGKNLTDPKVIEVSKKIDVLISKFYFDRSENII